MPDMLVQLLKLPPLEPCLEAMRSQDIVIRRANPFEAAAVREFVSTHFGTAWADEVAPGLMSRPGTVALAIREGQIIGFAAFECTRKAFFGPTGVAEAERGKGIGKALLVASMWGLRELGYVYGIIGGAGPTAFYEGVVGAGVIPDSSPGIYEHMLRSKPKSDA
ncbi:MAG: GNAT family N-acetyltransferase [Armatimonadetes bacterium]|nr:GNAT family N-acetyltransferase [Armatimonadota bacterium]